MRILIAVAAISIIGWSCETNSVKDDSQLQELEVAYKGNPEDTSIAMDFSIELKEVALAHKEDSISPFRLLQSALVERSIPGHELESIVSLRKVRDNYPNHEVAAEALFQEAFTWDEFVGNKDEAIKAYKEFKNRFPTHPRSATAQELLIILESDGSVLDLLDTWKEKENTETEE